MKSLNEYPEILSVTDIKKILGVGRVQAYELANSDQFHTVRVGKRILISKEVFQNWLMGGSDRKEGDGGEA
jgi:hypothetical protein